MSKYNHILIIAYILLISSCTINKKLSTNIEVEYLSKQDSLSFTEQNTQYIDSTYKVSEKPQIISNISKTEDTLKIGFYNQEEIIKKTPEYNFAMSELENINLEYQKQVKILQEELQNKYQEYSLIDDITKKKNKETELIQIQQSIQEFTEHANNELKKKQQQLITPIINKIYSVVKEIGDTYNFTYIFDNSIGFLPYISFNAEDITPLIKEKLNIQ